MLFKSKLSKNFEEDNYWIESLQNKIDRAWDFTSDRVDILEETNRFDERGYTKADTQYHDLEVRITSAYSDTREKLSDDHKNIIYKDVQHEQKLGRKYLFDMRDFNQPDTNKKSVWLAVNFDTVRLIGNSIIRRCNVNLGFLINNNTEEWYEPAIFDYDSKYTINYLNDILNVVRSEAYVTVQFNEYTKNIQVNDRFILGALDPDNISNNNVYKVKEVFKFGALETNNPNSIPLMVLALDRDIINPELDLISFDDNGKAHYIADYYKLKEDKQDNKDDMPVEPGKTSYYIKCTPIVDTIYQGETQEFECYVYDNNDTRIDRAIIPLFELEGTTQPERYYSFETIDTNHFKVTNKYKYFKSNLQITCKAGPSIPPSTVEPLVFDVQLGEAL